MAFCIWGLSWISCGIVDLFKWTIGLFLPGISSQLYFFVALIISSIAVYILGAMLGRVGGIILSIVGMVGALVTAGTSLILTVIGMVMVFFGNPKLLVLLNLGIFGLCALCHGI